MGHFSFAFSASAWYPNSGFQPWLPTVIIWVALKIVIHRGPSSDTLVGFEVSQGIGIFLNSQDDSNVQSRLRIIAIGSPSGSTSPGSTTPIF